MKLLTMFTILATSVCLAGCHESPEVSADQQSSATEPFDFDTAAVTIVNYYQLVGLLFETEMLRAGSGTPDLTRVKERRDFADKLLSEYVTQASESDEPRIGKLVRRMRSLKIQASMLQRSSDAKTLVSDAKKLESDINAF